MSPVEIVRRFYDSLKRGDAPTALGLLANKLEWTEAEGSPYFSGTWRTPQEVAEKLFGPLSGDWETFAVEADAFVSEAAEVVAFGVYRGTNRATGRSVAAPFAHRWRVNDGRITRFTQYTDTILVSKAMQ